MPFSKVYNVKCYNSSQFGATMVVHAAEKEQLSPPQLSAVPGVSIGYLMKYH